MLVFEGPMPKELFYPSKPDGVKIFIFPILGAVDILDVKPDQMCVHCLHPMWGVKEHKIRYGCYSCGGELGRTWQIRLQEIRQRLKKKKRKNAKL